MAKVVYSNFSETLRQEPEGYLLAHKNPHRPRTWLMEPDLAADRKLVARLTIQLLDYNNKYSVGNLRAIENLVNVCNDAANWDISLK